MLLNLISLQGNNATEILHHKNYKYIENLILIKSLCHNVKVIISKQAQFGRILMIFGQSKLVEQMYEEQTWLFAEYHSSGS